MNNKLIQEVEHLEDKIQMIKWALMAKQIPLKVKHSTFSIVRATAGIFSKAFPSGTTYENKMRKAWRKHADKLVS